MTTKKNIHDPDRILRSLEDGFLRADKKGCIIMANEAIANMCGFSSPEEMIGLPMKKLYSNPKERDVLLKKIHDDGKLLNCEVELLRKDGSCFWSLNNIKTFSDEKGNVLGTEGVIRDITKLKTAEEKLDHANKVLTAIRKVNQLITREKDPVKLLPGICNSLTKNRGYFNVWIMLLDEKGKYEAVYQSGLGEEFKQLKSRLKKNDFTNCALKTLEQKEVVTIKDIREQCHDCSLSELYKNRGAMTAPIIHNDRLFGLITASIPKKFLTQNDVELFKEVTNDIGLALHSLESTKQKRKLAETVNALPEPISLISSNYRYSFVNQVYADMYGVSKDEITGANLSKYLGKEFFTEKIKPQLDRCLKGENVEFEYQREIRGKGFVWFHMEYHPYYDEKGEITGILAHGFDITRRKRLEKNLEEKTELLNATGEMARVGGWELDTATNKVTWSDVTYSIHEVPPDLDPPLEEAINFFHPEDRPKLQEALNNAAEKGEPYDLTLRFITAKGKQLITRTKCRPEMKDGKVVKLKGTFQDVTDWKTAEENLRAANQQLHAAYQQLSASEEELRASNQQLAANEQELLSANQQLISSEQQLIAANQQLTANEQQLIAANQQITANEKELRKSESKYRNLFENLVDEVHLWKIIKHKNGQIKTWELVDANPSSLKSWGKKKEQVIGKTADEIFKTDTTRQFLPIVKNIFKTGKPQKWESYFAPTDQYLSMVSIPMGEFFISTGRDITIQKKAENKLIESEEKYRVISENAKHIIITHNLDGEITYANPFALDFLKISKDQVIGKNVRDFVTSREELEAMVQRQKDFITGKSIVHQYEIKFKLPTGEDRIMEMFGNPIRQNGKITSVLIVGYDITDRKKAEAEILRAKEKAEESDHLKSAFLANMSHEIRTPMNGILGFTNLLNRPDLSEFQQKKYIDVIEASGQRMLNIINDIIDISKIESGTMEVDTKEVNIIDQLNYVFTFFKPEAEKKGLDLILNNTIPAKVAKIKTDGEKLSAVLINLIKNAIKYTDKGSVEIKCDLTKVNKDEFLQFSVQDTGIGIAKERQEAIFERFIQADIEDIHTHDGAGLGLSISMAYVKMMGGKLWLESKKGKGSVFYFSIPCKALIEKTNNKEKTSDKDEVSYRPNLKILIADDDEASSEFISIITEDYGKEIIHAKTGTEAVEACRNNPDIQLVLMDIRMPGTNGYKATQQIRRFNKEAIIIAQTAYGLSGDREKALEAGCNDYIAKPIEPKKLLQLIQKYF